MVLHIFSSTPKERSMVLHQYFYADPSLPSDNTQSGNRSPLTVKGIKHIKLQKHHRKIPGYWLVVEFTNNACGYRLMHDVIRKIPKYRRDGGVFYPDKELNGQELEKGWLEKYRFENGKLEETSRLFFQEIRSHLREGRPNNAYLGVLMLLRLNPFFLKRYRRHYLLEDLAVAFDSLGNFGKVVKCYQLQSRIRPESSDPHLNLSGFYIVSGMEEKAVAVLKKAIRNDPANPFLISNLIVALSNLGHYETAVHTLKRRLEKDIQNGHFWKMLGDVYYEMEENQAAVRSYKKALSVMKTEDTDLLVADLYSGLAACYYEEEKYQKALEYYHKVLKIVPRDTYILINLAQLYFYKQHNSKEALKYAKMILETMPENGYAHYHLGLIYMDLGHIDKARWHLYKARRIMPSYNPVHEAIQLLKKFQSKRQR